VSGETTGGEELFQQAMESLKRNKVGLKGELAGEQQGERRGQGEIGGGPSWE
jgi:hypothetical protein